MSEPERIDPRKLRPGPIRHESLPPELLGRIVALWYGITAAWLAYHEKFLGGQR